MARFTDQYGNENNNGVFLKDLKKGEEFKFNGLIHQVRQKFSDWRKNDEPYLKTECGQVFWHDELIVQKITKPN